MLIYTHTVISKDMNRISEVNPKLLSPADLGLAIARIKAALSTATGEQASKLHIALQKFEGQQKR